jgi:hypothetical protein
VGRAEHLHRASSCLLLAAVLELPMYDHVCGLAGRTRRDMLDRGLDPDDTSQMTPLGVLPTQPGRRSALHFAVIYGRAEFVKALLQRGANANGSDRFGWQPLHFAALNGRPSRLEIVQVGAQLAAACRRPYLLRVRRVPLRLCPA